MQTQQDDFDESRMFATSAVQSHSRRNPHTSMPEPVGNPLAKYFRTPGVHVKLPTNGVFMPPGSVEFTMNGEVAVYPMRGADEMLLKSPDALMSGYAVEELIKSCVPAIQMPRLLSSPDLDVLLLAIRAATYGEVMPFSPVCPSCGVVNTVHRNLSFLLTNMQPIERDNTIRLNDEVIVYVRPHNLDNVTRIGVASFEEARRLQAMEHSEDSAEDKAQQINQSMKRISDLTTQAMTDCVLKVVVPGAEVVAPHQIAEFLLNISKAWTDAIQKKLDELNSKGIEKHYDVVCSECAHEWSAEIEFNPSTFFAAGSSA